MPSPFTCGLLHWASLVAQTVKCLPAMWETWVQSLGREDTLEKEMATHSSTPPGKFHGLRSLVGRSPWDHRIGHDWVTSLSFTLHVDMLFPSSNYWKICPFPIVHLVPLSKVCCCSVVRSCPILCDCSTPGFPVLHHLLGFVRACVHWVSDAIQPSHPLSSPSPPAFNLSSIRSFLVSQLFTSGDQCIGASASVSFLPMNIQGWLLLGLIDLILFQSKRLSRVFINTIVQKYQFFATQPSLWSSSHPYMITGKTIALTFVNKVMSLLFNMMSRFL